MTTTRFTRHRFSKIPRAVLPLLFAACFAAGYCTLPASAEIIHLKNGRTIVAEGVTESGDKIVYEGTYGQVTIPRNQVDRIERGGPLPPRLDPNRPDAAPASADAAPRITSDLPLT